MAEIAMCSDCNEVWVRPDIEAPHQGHKVFFKRVRLDPRKVQERLVREADKGTRGWMRLPI